MVEHIYISKHYGKGEIKILCSNKWVKAEHETPDSHRCDGYHINGIHQWSLGAGHNATCPHCLIEHAGRKMKTDNILMGKILKLAKENVKNEKYS